jgi:hypothetical protein
MFYFIYKLVWARGIFWSRWPLNYRSSFWKALAAILYLTIQKLDGNLNSWPEPYACLNLTCSSNILNGWMFWCFLLEVWPWTSCEGRRLKLAFFLSQSLVPNIVPHLTFFLLYFLSLLPITWIMGVARHWQDFPWLFVTTCEYEQYSINLVIKSLHLRTI